jgi:hypothetical protein
MVHNFRYKGPIKNGRKGLLQNSRSDQDSKR